MNRGNRLLGWMLGRIYMAEAGGGGGEDGSGGGGGTGDGGTGDQGGVQITVDQARADLKDYLPEGVEIADDKLIGMHGKLKPVLERSKADWAPDWRDKMANGDEKARKQLDRYASPMDVWTKARALEQRMTSGELRSTLPKDANEDQVKAWRAENGIPDTADKYEIKMRDGLVIGENDKPIVDEFLKSAHAANFTAAQASAATQWYFEQRELQAKAQAELDAKQATEGEDILRAEFGGEYRKNMNLVTGLLSMFPKEAANGLMNGRTASGKPFMNDPDVIRGLLDLAKMVNPTGTPMTGGEEGMAKSVDEEIKAIEARMVTDRAGYDKDEKQQARLRELYDARDNIQKRNRQAA